MTSYTCTEITSNELDQIASELLCKKFECIDVFELSNGAHYKVIVDGIIDDFNREDWLTLIRTGTPGPYLSLPTLMNGLYKVGRLERGIYYVAVYW